MRGLLCDIGTYRYIDVYRYPHVQGRTLCIWRRSYINGSTKPYAHMRIHKRYMNMGPFEANNNRYTPSTPLYLAPHSTPMVSAPFSAGEALVPPRYRPRKFIFVYHKKIRQLAGKNFRIVFVSYIYNNV